MPVARRVLGEDHDIMLRMRWNYAEALCADTGATLDDTREAVTTLEDTARISHQVLGGAHPHTTAIESKLQRARVLLSARSASPYF